MNSLLDGAEAVEVTIASTDRHFEEILALQRRNHLSAVSTEVQNREGFVFAEHTVPLLRSMAALSPQAIALSGGSVVGYCLTLPRALKEELPSLLPMFRQFGRCDYRGRRLSSYRYFVGGQVCVDRKQRGQGLLARLYERLRESLAASCDLCVTEISVRNQVSIRAHEKVGFEIISRYSGQGEDWVIVAWDLRVREGKRGN
ncbi:MAG: GNAT family N-acetyltransferase [Thermoanaerobaculia bacterium]